MKLDLPKKDHLFLRQYVKAGLAKSNSDAVEHALRWFFRISKPPRNYKPPKMSKEQLAAKRARMCKGIIAAYRMYCDGMGVLERRKAFIHL